MRLRSIKDVPYSIWVITCAHVVTDMAPAALLVALPYLKTKFGLSYAETTAIVLIQNLTSSVSQPIFGYVSDKKSRPWWMPVGCLMTGVLMLASLLVSAYPLVLLCTACSGFGGAIFHPEGAKTVNRLSGKAKGKGASLFTVGGNAGFAVGSLFMGALLVGGSFSLYFFVLPYLVISVIFLFALKKLPPLPQRNVQSSAKLAVKVNLPLVALLGMVLTRATVNSGINAFVPLYYVSFLHGSSAYAASLLTVYSAAGAVGTLLGGTMSDRYGSRKVMFISILPAALLLDLFKILDGIWAFVLLALVGVLMAATYTSSLVLAQKMMPNNIAMASGLTLGFSIGLGALGVLGLGHVADVAGLALVFNILAFLPIVGFMFTLFIQEPAEAAETAEALNM